MKSSTFDDESRLLCTYTKFHDTESKVSKNRVGLSSPFLNDSSPIKNNLSDAKHSVDKFNSEIIEDIVSNNDITVEAIRDSSILSNIPEELKSSH